jgi:hypothetical protein
MLHRVDQRHRTMIAAQPMSRWRRGEHWQRRLIHKLNGREFAQKLGCQVPDLYWQRRRLNLADLAMLPGKYVLKPTRGTSAKGAYLMHGSTEMFSGQSYNCEELYKELLASRGRFSTNILLAEEFVQDEQPSRILPLEYRVHVFSGKVAAIQVVHRAHFESGESRHRFYTPDWELFDDLISTRFPLSEVIQPPRCLPDMLMAASKLGKPWGTYVRVDMYAGTRGAVFGEYSSTPSNGNFFTPFADEYLGALWQHECPDQV